MRFYAHSRAGEAEESWELLEDHLHQVAAKAESLAAAFGAGPWGSLAGLWHDVGKYRSEFQRRLRGEQIQAEHAGVGAALALENGPVGLPIAFAIAGHHSGLANLSIQGDSDRRPLLRRVRENSKILGELRALMPLEFLGAELPSLPARFLSQSDQLGGRRSAEMFTRFVFSALVDADRLCTEAFYEPDNRLGESSRDSIGILQGRLDSHIDALSRVDSTRAVNQVRAEVLAACRAKATEPAGFFSLTVPTGGGKTLSAMSFALRHADRCGLRRVIVVIPYTSIIEQNAEIYASILGADNVIEHHSNLDETKAREENAERERQRQLATENWDAPIVVTTTVQFFESLFSGHPSRCRKLHNIAKSVIVLDEVQTLPPWLLSPILDALRELVASYGCTVVFSTATPPALSEAHLSFGLAGIREIASNPAAHATSLRRVEVSWPDKGDVAPYAAVAAEMTHHDRVMTIVHLRKDARHLAELLPTQGRYHLSALMCAAHRLKVLNGIRNALEAKQVCRVVATQLVEAGVDIDFPVVYRTLAGLDSLTQAAGRCNREGQLVDESGQPIPGRFIVFRAETKPPARVLRMALETTETLIQFHGSQLDLLAPETSIEFFRSLYFKIDADAEGIQTKRADHNFADVEHAFQMIEDYSVAVVMPYGDARERLDRYRRAPSRVTRRGLQPFIVQVTPRQLQALSEKGAIEQIDEAVLTLSEPFSSLYDDAFGLRMDADVDTSQAWIV